MNRVRLHLLAPAALLAAVLAAHAVERPSPFPAYYPSADDKTAAETALSSALTHLEAGEPAEAAGDARAALQLVPTSATPHVLLAMVAEQQEQSEEAVAEYREALAWKPDETRALAGLERLGAEVHDSPVAVYEQQLIDLTNESRAAGGLATLKPHPVLAEVARGHSRDMRDLGFFSHTSPRPGKTHAIDRFKQLFDERPWSLGENVAERWTRPEPALGPRNILRTHVELMHSPPHHKNIMSPESVYIGVGIATNEAGDYWVTELFMKPRPEQDMSKYRAPE